VNGLVQLEVAERIEAFEAAMAALDARIGRWSQREVFVVADSSFYIQNEVKLAEVDLHEVLNVPRWQFVRLLFPIVVVDELDDLKDAGKQRARWRAAHTLGLLDGVLNGDAHGILHEGEHTVQDGETRGRVNVEIVLDPPGHVRLDRPDVEIIDRTVAIQGLAGRNVRLLTCDTSQHTRGRAAGLQVTKVATKDPGDEPDWSAPDRSGTGVRAQRRARQARSRGSYGQLRYDPPDTAPLGWDFERVGVPEAVLLANVRWLSRYRHPRCWQGPVAARLMEVFSQPGPLMPGEHPAATRAAPPECGSPTNGPGRRPFWGTPRCG
jgi:hypothetical protein